MVARRLSARLGYRLGQFGRTATALGEVVTDGHPYTLLRRDVHDRPVLTVMVGGKRIHGNDRCDSVLADVGDLLAEVRRPGEDVIGVLGQHLRWQRPTGDDPVFARVGFQVTHRRDDDGSIRCQPGRAALDVEELFRADICTEPRLGDEVVTRMDADQVGDDGGVTGGDVAERTRVHENWRLLHGLHQVRLDGILQHHRHGAGHLERLSRHWIAIAVVADDDSSHSLAEITQ